ncbi:MAG: T9SS type A sorting domain-containing protein [Bacteroidales bacterium]|jgi:hypothetical protein|nr:T9SS type A sorting domain-containing protein [Bacteroidales bacterium]
MKKVLLLCMSAFIMVNWGYSQSLTIKEKPTQKSAVQKDLSQKANNSWEVQFIDTIEPAFSMPLGAVSDGNHIYMGSVNKKFLFKVDFTNQLLDSIDIAGMPGASGVGAVTIGLAYDGTYIYMTNGNDTIYQIDLITESVSGKVVLPTGTYPIGITYAPDADNNNGGFWVSLGTDYALQLFSRTGDLLDSILSTDLNYSSLTGDIIWALAYDNFTPGGPFVYAMERYPHFIISINPSTKKLNAVVKDISADVPEWDSIPSYAMYIQNGVIAGTTTLGAINIWGYHIGYNLASTELPDLGLTIQNSFTKPWLELGEAAAVSVNAYRSGKAAITSCDFNFNFNGDVYSQALSGVDISNVYPLTLVNHDSSFSMNTEGSYDLKMWFSNLNGNAAAFSDTFSMTVDVYEKVAQRIVLHEVFTSSTCAPCRLGNMLLDSVFAKNPNKFTCIKYQMNWPSPGDPYYTNEGGIRRAYYEVNSVPYLVADGDYYGGSPGSYTSSMLQMEYIQPSFIDFDATFVTDGDHLYSTNLTVTPLKTITGTHKLYVALVEKVTHMNMKTNEETSFYYVHKKFMTDASGQSITLQADQDVVVDLNFKFVGKYRLPFNAGSPINPETEHSVENFNNIMLVYWVQDDATKNVLQSGKVDAATLSVEDYGNNTNNVKVYPNPSDGKINIYSENMFTRVKLVNMLGQVVYNVPVTANEFTFEMSDLHPGIYVLQLQTEKGLISRKISIK